MTVRRSEQLVAVREQKTEIVRQLGLFDCAMIGSGIFIVPAGMARTIGSPGWLIATWLLTGALTVGAAAIYGELASALPESGGMYHYLRECFSPSVGFLYGWTFFTVIQTGSIAAVAVAFARFLGFFAPSVSERHYLVAPIHLGSRYAVSLSTTQLVAIGVILVLSAANAFGLRYGKWLQNVLTVIKIGSLGGLIAIGVLAARRSVLQGNFAHFFAPHATGSAPEHFTSIALLAPLVAICVAQSGSLFSADSWHNVAFASEEVREPRRTLPRALILGSMLVVTIYLCVNPSLSGQSILPGHCERAAGPGRYDHDAGDSAALWRCDHVGCDHDLHLRLHQCINPGRRAGLLCDGPRWPVLSSAQRLNRFGVPGWSLAMQMVWSVALLLVTTYSPSAGYGNLYGDLLDYVIAAALLFYVLTVTGVMVLRRRRPDLERPYRIPWYPWIPLLYILLASTILLALAIYRPAATWPGFGIVLCGYPVYLVLRRNSRRHEAGSATSP